MKSLLLLIVGATVGTCALAADEPPRSEPGDIPSQERTRAEVVRDGGAPDTLSPQIQRGEVTVPNPDYVPRRTEPQTPGATGLSQRRSAPVTPVSVY